MSKRTIGFFLFFIGLLATIRVRLIGLIGISEIPMFILAPLFFLQDFAQLKRDGFCGLLYFTALSMVGCALSCLYNHTNIALAIKGLASPYAIFAGIVVFHRLLRKDFSQIRWLALGFGFSLIFNMLISGGGGIDIDFERGSTATGSVRFLYVLLPLILCPVAGWYLKIPLTYSAIATFGLGVFSLMSSASGRSMALAVMSTGAMVVYARKDVRNMQTISKHVLTFLAVAILGLILFKAGYSQAAQRGWLGEGAYEKYLRQTKGNSGVVQLLIGGRIDSFVGYMAALERPIAGYGPWAIDTEDCYGRFLYKYGEASDYRQFRSAVSKAGGIVLLPTHSHIGGFWVHYGILGLFFWLYVIYLVYKLFRYSIANIPEFYGYIAVWLPSMMWAIFFSPFTERLQESALLTVMLFAINAKTNRRPRYAAIA